MYRCDECSMNFKSKRSLSNHNRIHKDNKQKLRGDVIFDYVNNYMTYIEINDKYKISLGTICKFVKGIPVDKNLKTQKRKKERKKFNHTEETKKQLSVCRTEWLKNNPDKHVWKRNNKFKSVPCEYLKNILRNNGFEFIEEYSPLLDKYYSIDISFPNKKIGLEINGNQHYNSDQSLKDYYLNRKKNIERTGWKLYDIHYMKVYDELFVRSLIDELMKNNLNDVDFSFYIKKKKEKIVKEDKISPIIEKIKNSNIDFSEQGWVKKVSKIIGISDNKGGYWIKNNMIDFYESNCKKRTVSFKNEHDYYSNPIYCKECGNVIPFEKRFHIFDSRSCASTYNSRLRKVINNG